MAILDENTQYIPGVNGSVDTMRLQLAADGKTVVHFIHYKQLTRDHVDVAEIVGEVAFGETDLKNFNKLLSDHIKKHFK